MKVNYAFELRTQSYFGQDSSCKTWQELFEWICFSCNKNLHLSYTGIQAWVCFRAQKFRTLNNRYLFTRKHKTCLSKVFWLVQLIFLLVRENSSSLSLKKNHSKTHSMHLLPMRVHQIQKLEEFSSDIRSSHCFFFEPMWRELKLPRKTKILPKHAQHTLKARRSFLWLKFRFWFASPLQIDTDGWASPRV